MHSTKLSLILTVSLLCLAPKSAQANSLQMNVGVAYSIGVLSIYSFNFRDSNQLVIASDGTYLITATTDNYSLPPIRNPRPGIRRIHSFNCHFSTINIKALDGSILKSVSFPNDYSTNNQTATIEVSLPPGVYNVEVVGIVNGRATSGLGHRGKFELKTTLK